MQSPEPEEIAKLSDSEATLAYPAEDLRGRTVCDSNGDEIGHVHDLVIDERKRRVRFLCVESAGLVGMGVSRFLVPVEAVTRVSSDSVRIDRDMDQMIAAPGYEPDLVDEDYMRRLYDYYGYSPFWRAGYTYASLPFHY